MLPITVVQVKLYLYTGMVLKGINAVTPRHVPETLTLGVSHY